MKRKRANIHKHSTLISVKCASNYVWLSLSNKDRLLDFQSIFQSVNHSSMIALLLQRFGSTHWGRMTHICVRKLSSLGSDYQKTNAVILLIWSLGTKFSEILIEIRIVSLKKMGLNVSSGKWRSFCLGLNVLTTAEVIAIMSNLIPLFYVVAITYSVVWPICEVFWHHWSFVCCVSCCGVVLLRVTDNEMPRLVTVVMTPPWVAHVLGQNNTPMTSWHCA